MMNALLMAVVRFFETVVNYALGAVLIALGVIGIVAVCRWLLSRPRAEGCYGCFGRAVGVLRKGSGSLALAAVLVIGLVLLLAGLSVR